MFKQVQKNGLILKINGIKLENQPKNDIYICLYLLNTKIVLGFNFALQKIISQWHKK
jgi:hypothetical protein